MIKAIIFDCFGVIITDALKVMIDELAQTDPAKAKQAEDLVHKASRGHVDADDTNEQMAKLLGILTDEYIRRKADGEVRDQPLLDYIKLLRQDYKVGLLSNVSNGGLLRRFNMDELNEHFDASIASAEIGFAKPEPQAYETIADKLGVRLDECIFTDDREQYCEGARAVGMKVIRYDSFAQFKTELETVLK